MSWVCVEGITEGDVDGSVDVDRNCGGYDFLRWVAIGLDIRLFNVLQTIGRS